ncbi:ATP-binding protein [Streptomyces qinzhouensis]|uniref:ATP-binding protein n=1 Tax=Streptomyces qinzhouensis TaxID=2599401 RepID=UPI003CCC6D11
MPTSSSMAVPHGPAGVGEARHRMREQLRMSKVPESVVDDAMLILSELLSNACRHGRPLGHADRGDGNIRAAWRVDRAGRLTVAVTDGGGPTRPVPSTPSVTARGGRGLQIITALSQEWGVRDHPAGEVTVWALIADGARHDTYATRVTGGVPGLGFGFTEPYEGAYDTSHGGPHDGSYDGVAYDGHPGRASGGEQRDTF